MCWEDKMFKKVLFSLLLLTGCECQIETKSNTPVEQQKQRFRCIELATDHLWLGGVVIDTETNQEFLVSRSGGIIKIR